MKTYYYHDPLKDDFAATDNIKTKTIPDNYKYIDWNPLYLLGEMLIRLIAYPIVLLIVKIGYLQRIKNRKVLLKAAGKGYYIYGNHTDYMLDAYNPTILSFPVYSHIITNPDAVSLPGLGVLVKMLGAVPVPASLASMRSFRRAISRLIKRHHIIMIYPEAHIWPFYTDIRPFGKESFHYPADDGAPCFTCTNVYVKRLVPFIKLPKVVTYIDGPFLPDMSLPKPERIKKLRDEVYNAMKKRVDENPKYNYNNYIYVEDESMTNKKAV